MLNPKIHYWNRFTVVILKFLDRQVWANSVDPEQTACSWRNSLIRAYTVCHFACIYWMHCFTVKPPCLNFRVITADFSGVWTFTIFTLHVVLNYLTSNKWPNTLTGSPKKTYSRPPWFLRLLSRSLRLSIRNLIRLNPAVDVPEEIIFSISTSQWSRLNKYFQNI